MRYSIMLLVTAIFVLFIIASVALYSIDFAREYYSTGSNSNFFFKYIVYISLSMILALLIIFFLPEKFIEDKKYVWFFYIIVLAMLVLPLYGPFSSYKNGARRWIEVSGNTFQPSELAKIFVIYFIAHYIKDNKEKLSSFWDGLIKPLLLISPILLLIFVEPDLSTTFIIFLTAVVMLYFGGTRFSHVLFLFVLIGLLFIFGVQFGLIHSYQIGRIKNYVSNEIPWQLEKAYEAIGNGGIIGSGPALGKYYIHVPQAESDFILATIGESFGYLGIIIVILSYLAIVTSLIKISDEIDNEFIRYFIWGFSTLMMLQVVVNTGVVSGLFPITGIPLPFVSYGGSSILAFSIGFGIIFSEIFIERGR